ncbi:MAG: hypothetical protein KGI70_01175 [Patescibacteria group bacterium]|nr:hypothetical protein [Patescibacteria group bacterium]
MLGIVPLRNIHLTGNARFIFHEPYSVGLFGSTQTDPVATLQFTQLYPEWVRGALLRKGGLNGVDNYITLAGPELKTLFASAVRKKASGKTYEPIELFARTKKVLPAHVPLPKPRPKERPFSAHQLY